VNAQNGFLARLFLRYASPLAGLRRVPVLGPCASWVSGKLIPRDTLTWTQVRRGPGEGLWLRLNPRSGGEYFHGEVEPDVQDILQEFLRPGMTIYDIGANIGFFSLLAARLTGESGKVTSFEADPEIAARLREHIARNEFANISVQEMAVWSESRLVPFARADAATSPDRGLGHVDLSAAGGNIAEVQGVSLDDFARGAPAPDFIKCDAEGAEVEIFRGARKLLAEKRPIILCEMHSEENRRTLTELWSSHGFSCQSRGKNQVLALPQ
jgi:FkbM family methyltransferase